MIEFNSSNYESVGSYIVVKRIEKMGFRTCRGRVMFENARYNYNDGDMIIYDEHDSKYVKLDKDAHEMVLHQHVILKEKG